MSEESQCRTLSLQQNFYLEVCCVCGLAYAMPAEFRAKRVEDGKTFYCPNGHTQIYCRRTTEIQRLTKLLEDKQRLVDQSHNREAVMAEALKKGQMANRRLAKRLESDRKSVRE